MVIKIYFHSTPLILATDEMSVPETILEASDIHAFDAIDAQFIKNRIHELYESKANSTVIIHENIDELKNNIFQHFEVIDASGGIVQNEQKDLLFIFRKGKWDFPKGKMEEGEDAAECAMREVTEETGIEPLQLIYPVGITYHVYKERGKDILKISHWFHFTTTSTALGKPQIEEDITKVEWIATRDLKKPMKNSYETIKEILNTFFDQP